MEPHEQDHISEQVPAAPRPTQRRWSSPLPIIIISLLVILLVIVSVLLLRSDQSESVVPTQTDSEAAEANQEVLTALSELMMLPENETPSIATIVDAEMLIAEQNFYAGSQNGDQLILYPQSQRAIIFSPERNIIVNAGSLVVSEDPTN